MNAGLKRCLECKSGNSYVNTLGLVKCWKQYGVSVNTNDLWHFCCAKDNLIALVHATAGDTIAS